MHNFLVNYVYEYTMDLSLHSIDSYRKVILDKNFILLHVKMRMKIKKKNILSANMYQTKSQIYKK